MASGVYYNQEVTAEMLNGMAADLGHTSFNGFGSEKFGADELNKITGDLVSAGVLISGNMCRVIKDDSGNIILQTGIIVFGNGAKMEIVSPIIIDASAGSYIYALNDTQQGECSIEVAESYPAEGDYVKLCKINTDGTLMDTRNVSKAKMELFIGNTQKDCLLESIVLNDDNYIELARISIAEYEIYNNIFISNTFSYGTFGMHFTNIRFNYEYKISDTDDCLKIKFTQEDDSVIVWGKLGGYTSSLNNTRSVKITFV